MQQVNLESWKHASQIYLDLMDLTVSNALDRLNQMDSIDDEIRSLVLGLISTGNQPSQYFNQHVGANFQFEAPFESSFQVGDHLGGYELEAELGVGGMAKVYRAIKTDAQSQKPVAIKLFNHPSLSPVMLERFAFEQDVLSGLSHKNIVNMHHSGSTETGVPFIVMELIEGGLDIDEYIKSKPTSLRQKIKWMVDAARAIAHAHNNLIIHRDIKPSNLLIDENEQLKVVDFGIAKLVGKVDAPHKTTIMALTPSFAAPEQINSESISVTTDIFSLAAVCLSLIIEELPLPTDRLIKSCAEDESHIWQVLRRQVKDKDLRNILNQALQQNPEQRYRNMDAFADDLSAWLHDKPVKATPDSWLYRINKFASRRRALFAALMTLLLTVGISIILLTWQYRKTLQEVEKTTQVKNFMLNVFEVTHPDVNQGQALSALDLLNKARINLDSSDQNQSELKSELLLAIGTAFYQVGDWEQARTTLANAYALEPANQDVVISYAEVLVALKQTEAVNELIKAHPNLLDSAGKKSPKLLRLMAGVDILNEDYQAGNDLLSQAHDIDQQQQNFPSLIKTITDQTSLAFLQSDFNTGIKKAELALKKYTSKFPPAHSGILKLKNALSVLYTKTGEFGQSQTILEDMLALQKRHLGDEHPDLIQSMINLSESYYAQGKLDQAKEISTAAHLLALKKFGEGHPKLIETLAAIAVVVFVQGDYELSLSMMQKAIDISVESYGETHIETTKLQGNYATALIALRRNDEAKEILESILRIQQETLGKTHNNTLYTQLAHIRVLSALGENELAIKYAEEVRDIFEAEPERTGPIKSNAMYGLGIAYFEAEQYLKSIQVFQKIENENVEASESANSMVLTKTLARSFKATEQYDQAIIYAKKSIALSERLLGAGHIRTDKVRLLLAEIYIDDKQAAQAKLLLDELKKSVGETEHRDREEMLNHIDELFQQITSPVLNNTL